MNIEIPQRRTYNQKHFTSGDWGFTMETEYVENSAFGTTFTSVFVATSVI